MARFYPTTILAVLVCIVLVLFYFTIPKTKTSPKQLGKEDIIIPNGGNLLQFGIDKPLMDRVLKDDNAAGDDRVGNPGALVEEEHAQPGKIEGDAGKAQVLDETNIINKAAAEEGAKVIGDKAAGRPEVIGDKIVAKEEQESLSDIGGDEAKKPAPVPTYDIINVLVTSDNRTLGGLVAAVNSVHKNTKAHVRFYLLVDTVSVPHLKSWIEKTELKDIDYVLKAFNESLVKNKIKVRDARKDLGSPLNFARYYFPVVFPSIRDRLIVIDVDSIIQGDIQELWGMELEAGHAAAFSDDCSSITYRSSLIQTKFMDFLNFKNPRIKALNMNPMTCSYNTGVFVVDVNEWRKQRITKQLDQWLALNAYEELYGNQRGGGNSGPPFYIVFYNKYTQMSPSWNVRHLGTTTISKYSHTFLASAKLLHWNGPYKPWGRVAQHTEDWEKYYISDPTGQFKVVRRFQTI